MYSSAFHYHRATSVSDARRLLQQHPGAKVLAGGHSLIPLLKMRLAAPPALIDIGRIAELKGITASGGKIRIGALTTHAELAGSAALTSGAPILAEAASMVGDAQVRNCGTIGGNVAHADPASDLPTVLLALDAAFVVAGAKGERTIAAADFFQGMMATALDDDEILTAIEVPSSGAGVGMSYAKFTHPASRYAVVGAAAIVTMQSGACSAARVSVGGLVPAATRAADVESAIIGSRPSADGIVRAAALVANSLGTDVLDDIFASAEYRRAMAAVYVKRALTTAFERAA